MNESLMKIVVIEDEKPAARMVDRALSKLGYSIEVVLYSVAEAVSWFNTNEEPDLILADIQLADGSSFDIFDLVSIAAPVIFITAYDEYTLKAFKLNSVDYLLKPVDIEELSAALTKFKNQRLFFQAKNNYQLIRPMEHQYINRFLVRIAEKIVLVSIDSIVCIYREDRGIYIQTDTGRSYLIEESSIDVVQPKLDPKLFYRVNRKILLKIHSIQKIVQHSNARLQVILKGYPEEVIVSRERVSAFKKWLAAV